MYATLNNIGRHGHRSTHELIAKVTATNTAHPRSNSMRIDCQILSSSPYTQLSEVAHAETCCGRGQPRDRSIARGHRTPRKGDHTTATGSRLSGSGHQGTDDG